MVRKEVGLTDPLKRVMTQALLCATQLHVE